MVKSPHNPFAPWRPPPELCNTSKGCSPAGRAGGHSHHADRGDLFLARIRAELAGAFTFAALVTCAAVAIGYVADNPAGVISSNLRPYGAVALLGAAAMLAATRRPGRAMLFGLAGLGVFAHLGMTLYHQHAAWAAVRDTAGARELTLVNFNVFDRNAEDGARIVASLIEQRAAILVLTEATHLQPQMPMLREAYPYAAGCLELTENCDTIILAIHPVSEPSIRTLGRIFSNRFVSAKVTIGSEVITVVAVHLSKPYFDNHGWTELWQLIKLIGGLPGPLLVAGDFNATPWSRSIATLLRETKLLAGPLPVATWPAAIGGMGVPIDHIFTRAPAVLDEVVPLPGDLGSNHRGLVARIRY
jgi:endonuclease/exonuclease/phosphatase (EEP) superfamily protein YafD